MTKKQYAWSVRGVTREARDQAKIAARNREVTTGEWVSQALVTVADEELVVSPKSLLPIGPSPIASSVDAAAVEKLGARERALLALASKRPAPKSRDGHDHQAPWSIRGVSQAARLKASKVAAHRRVTIGDWVNHAILIYAARDSGIEPALVVQSNDNESLPEVSEKTMKLVETLARHFDETGAPGAAAQDTRRNDEIIDQARATDTAAAPAVASGHQAGDHTEEKISQLAEQVRNSELRNEKRLTELTKMMGTVAERLQSAAGGMSQAQDQIPNSTTEAPAKVSNAEMVYWESIKDSNDPDAYISYLESFPDGLFASLAKRRAARGEGEFVDAAAAPCDDGAAPPVPRRRPPPASAIPTFDYDTLNERAIENTKRRS